MADSFSAKLDFTGRVALITGGASGIGYAVATQLGELGARVAIADLNIDGAESAVTRLCAFGVEAMAVKVDVADPDDAERMVETTVAHFGKLDILVHSAGVGIERSFLETTPDEWRRLIDIDLSGTFYCAQALLRRITQKTATNLSLLLPLCFRTGKS